MKNIKCILICTLLILLTFSGCGTHIPDFKNENDNLQVYNMTFDTFGNIKFDNAGYANENVFSLSKPYLSRPSTKKQSSYVYKSTPNFSKNTEGALGIITYYGNSYVVFKEENTYILKGISLYSPGYERQYKFDDFIKSATDYYAEYKDTVSGGSGLKR